MHTALKEWGSKAKVRLKELLSSKYGAAAAIALGAAGMLLILFSGGSEDEILETAAETDSEWSGYRAEIEAELEDILSSIEGVGSVNVMVTVGSSEEYVYAQSSSRNNDKEEQDYVIIKNGSKEGALVKRVKAPSVTGVVIVCDGGASSKVCERVYNAVTAALGIPSSRIYVTEMR